jgi:hypothetical protein
MRLALRSKFGIPPISPLGSSPQKNTPFKQNLVPAPYAKKTAWVEIESITPNWQEIPVKKHLPPESSSCTKGQAQF